MCLFFHLQREIQNHCKILLTLFVCGRSYCPENRFFPFDQKMEEFFCFLNTPLCKIQLILTSVSGVDSGLRQLEKEKYQNMRVNSAFFVSNAKIICSDSSGM